MSLQPGAQGEIRLVAQVPAAARQAVAQAMLPWGLGQIPDTLVISVQPFHILQNDFSVHFRFDQPLDEQDLRTILG